MQPETAKTKAGDGVLAEIVLDDLLEGERKCLGRDGAWIAQGSVVKVTEIPEPPLISLAKRRRSRKKRRKHRR